MPIRVRGAGLLSLANDFSAANGCTRSQVVQVAGYYSLKPDGSTRLHFTDFYQEIIDTKKRLGLWSVIEDEEDEDEEIERSEMDLAVMELLPSIDDDDIADFSAEVKACGLDPSELRERYCGQFSDEESFAEDMLNQQGVEIPSQLQGCIDWQQVFSGNYYIGYDSVEYGDKFYFFRTD